MAYSTFPLFQSHLDFAHHHWKTLLIPGDCVIDATCGNGHDALVLAKLSLSENSGSLYVFDIQDNALRKTNQMLQENLSPLQYARVNFLKQCHSQFPSEITPQSVSLVVYNLGYLPGADKTVTTKKETTIKSILAALPLLKHGGVISITCYPGHSEGKQEEDVILEMVSKLAPSDWSCSHHRWLNRHLSPSLLLIQKNQNPSS